MSLPTQPARPATNRIARLLVFLFIGALAVFFVGTWLADHLPERLSLGRSHHDPQRPAGSDPVFGVYPGIQPRYKLLATYEDNRKPTKSMPTAAKRTIARIVVPAGMAPLELEDNLRYANKEIFEKKKVDAQIVFAWKEGSDMKGPFTAGRLEFGPNGNYFDAAPDTPLDRFHATVELDTRYFQNSPASGGGATGARPK
jgi:hypothetical protein